MYIDQFFFSEKELGMLATAKANEDTSWSKSTTSFWWIGNLEESQFRCQSLGCLATERLYTTQCITALGCSITTDGEGCDALFTNRCGKKVSFCFGHGVHWSFSSVFEWLRWKGGFVQLFWFAFQSQFHVLRQAPAGSGKTLAYLVPLLQMLQHQSGPSQNPRSRMSRPPSPKAVIVAPTRELASQIAAQAQQLLGEMEIRVACIYGGVPYRSSNSSC